MYSTDKLQCHFYARQLKILPEKFSKSLVHNNCHTSTVTSKVSCVVGKICVVFLYAHPQIRTYTSHSFFAGAFYQHVNLFPQDFPGSAFNATQITRRIIRQ